MRLRRCTNGLTLRLLPILALWFLVVHQDDEILALIRNEVVTDAAGQRTWTGSFVNTNETTLRDVGVTVDFLDRQNHSVGKADAKAAELTFRSRLELQAQLPRDAVRLRIYSVQWRMDGRGVLIGAFREPWEFGYAVAASRPLALVARSRGCLFCRQNFTAGAELYGGLATAHDFGFDGTSHYAGPTLGFNLPKGPTISFSPQFGLNDNSVGTLWRFKVSYEVQQFRDWFRGWGKK